MGNFVAAGLHITFSTIVVIHPTSLEPHATTSMHLTPHTSLLNVNIAATAATLCNAVLQRSQTLPTLRMIDLNSR